MGDVKDYQNDFERLMATAEAKADRIADASVEQFVDNLRVRARAVGIKLSELCDRVQSDDGFDGILAEIKSREARQAGKESK